MFDSWTVNWFIISNILTVALVIISYFVLLAKEKKNSSSDSP